MDGHHLAGKRMRRAAKSLILAVSAGYGIFVYMSTETIRELLERRPFEPFEVRMSNGDTHEIKHPEFVILMPSRLVIADPGADRLAICSLLHITEDRMSQ